MIKTILVPIDGSAHANAALDLATVLARDHDASLLLLHVGFRGGNVPAELERRAEAGYAEAERAGTLPREHEAWSRHHRVLEFMGRMILEDGRVSAAGRGVPEVGTELDWGDPAERILHWAKHATADLLVMGSRGYSELQGLMLGSVSHKVLNVVACPCATVRTAGGASRLEAVRRILVATDGSEHGDRAVAFASEIAVGAGAELTILHLTLHGVRRDRIRRAAGDVALSEQAQSELDPAGGAVSRFAFYVSHPLSNRTLVEVGERILERAETSARNAGVSEVVTKFEEGDPATHILAHADRDRHDLVVLGTRGLGEVEGLIRGSVATKVTHLALCTVLSVR
jgi:nucleotide-binding universal stress UspA family protein